MKIDRYLNDDGQYRCFAVDNTQVSRTGMAGIVAKIPGVTIIKRPRFFDDAKFCEFSLNGHHFVVEEPYGDSSTYDVVASEAGLMEMEMVATHFESASPRIGGDSGYIIFTIVNMLAGAALLVFLLKAIAWLVG